MWRGKKMKRIKRKLKDYLNVWLLISFVLTVMVPLTGVQVHKLASTLFLILSVVHMVVYRKKLGTKRYLLFGTVFLAFASGVFGMIFDQYTVILALHKVISITLVFFLAIHIFVFHRRLCNGKDNKNIWTKQKQRENGKNRRLLWWFVYTVAKSTESKKSCVQNVRHCIIMRCFVLTNVLSWKQRPFVLIVRYIATKRIWEKKFVKWCGFPDQEWSFIIRSWRFVMWSKAKKRNRDWRKKTKHEKFMSIIQQSRKKKSLNEHLCREAPFREW